MRRVFRLLCSAVVQRYRSRSLQLFRRDTCIFRFDSALFYIVHQGVRSVAVCLCFRVWLLRLKPDACLHHNVRRRFVCYLRCVFACSCCCRIAACAYVCSTLVLRCTARCICSLRGCYVRMDSPRVRILFVARASPFVCLFRRIFFEHFLRLRITASARFRADDGVPNALYCHLHCV